MGALNEFCGSKVPLLKGLTCYVCKSSQTILIHELQAVSWKYTSEDDGFLLLCMRDSLCNEVVKLKLGLDYLKFKNSENGAEMVSFGQKLSFIKCFHFLVNS